MVPLGSLRKNIRKKVPTRIVSLVNLISNSYVQGNPREAYFIGNKLLEKRPPVEIRALK
jgi:hypothetical protein